MLRVRIWRAGSEHVIDTIERVIDLIGILKDDLDIAPKFRRSLTESVRKSLPRYRISPIVGSVSPNNTRASVRFSAPALSYDRRDDRRFVIDLNREVVERERRSLVDEAAAKNLAHIASFQ